jgi:hypothetical protein
MTFKLFRPVHVGVTEPSQILWTWNPRIFLPYHF